MQVRCDVAIVGGGASGVLVAAWLLRTSARPLHIALIDRSSAFAKGVAYGTADAWHLLNVVAGNMGVDPGRPDGFYRWALERGLPVKATDFLPRRLYGEYLAETLAGAEADGARRGSALFRVPAGVVDVVVRRMHVRVWLESGDHLRAETAVLATGNLPPANLLVPDAGLYASRSYARSPWQAGALDALRGDEQVVLIGSGLTAVDVALTLHARGHRGAVHMVSHHGWLPRVHAPAVHSYRYDGSASTGATARGLLRRVRRAISESEARGGTWREAIDAVRPHTVSWWRSLSVPEQRRFMRHLRQRWEIHRHRMAPEVAAVVDELGRRGQLHVHAGAIARFEPAPSGSGWNVVFRPRGTTTERFIAADRVVNCTGPCPPAAATDEPVFRSLLIRGLARVDPLRLGFETQDGALILKNGRRSDRLYAVGPLRRGELWETTAMPEIREQAREVAMQVLDRLGAEPRDASAAALAPPSN